MVWRPKRADMIASTLEQVGCHLAINEIVFHVKKLYRVTLTPLKVEHCIRNNPEMFRTLLTYNVRKPKPKQRRKRRDSKARMERGARDQRKIDARKKTRAKKPRRKTNKVEVRIDPKAHPNW